MKFGMRKPSVKKSLRARTTGKVKRRAKRAANPLYGKRGMGLAKNPKKSVRSHVYKKVTFSIWDLLRPRHRRG